MKGKVKLNLHKDSCSTFLEIRLKMEDEWCYYHSKIVVSHRKKSMEEFYNEIIEFISDINNIKKAGEILMFEVIEEKIKKVKNKSKEEQAKQLLKKLKEPIEIEVE